MKTVTENPANGFDVKIEYWNGREWKPAWGRIPASAEDDIELIKIRRDGDFGAVIHTMPARLCR